MAWQMIHTSGVAYEFFFESGEGGDSASMTDSVIVGSGVWTVPWTIMFDTPQRVRLTFLSYFDPGATNSAFVQLDAATIFNEAPIEIGGRMEWIPSPVDFGDDTGVQLSYFNPTDFDGFSQEDSYTVSVEVWVDGDDYNCDCDCGFPTETLAQIRPKIASLMGYSSQLSALPESFLTSILVNLNMAQRLVVNDLSEIANDRYFTWPVAPGETKFCVYENLETCRNIMVATRVREVYFVGDGNVITRLDKGIPFQYYEAENPRSVPSRYQVRSCIEIWPPPVDAGTLVVRGTLAAVDLVDDTDKVMVDPTALLLRTVAFMKAAKGHADAANYMGQYWEVIGALCSDSHMDDRYVPGWLPRDSRLREVLTHHMEPRTYG